MKSNDTQMVNISDCPVCGNCAETVAEMPNYPVTEVYKPFNSSNYQGPTSADQRLLFCAPCQHMFLGKHLPRDFIYGNYVTESSASLGSKIALNNFYNFVGGCVTLPAATVIDIGANDTTLLEMFTASGATLIGIDPNISSDNTEIHCIKGYVEDCDLSKFPDGRRIFLCSHTLEHIYDPHAFINQISKVLDSEDDFFLQIPSFELLIRDVRFDQVHHQHLNYFSLRSLSLLLAKHGLIIANYHYDSDHYGALMCHVRKGIPSQELIGEKKNAMAVKNAYDIFTMTMKSSDARISLLEYGFRCFGASLMLPILSYYLPSLDRAQSILDSSAAKHGLTYVNFECPIVSDADFNYGDHDFVVTAVSTKLATRRVVALLSDRGARNIVLPLNTL